MMEEHHNCPQEARFIALEKENEKVYRTLNGNGQEGVVKKVTRLETKVDSLQVTVNNIEKGQSELYDNINKVIEYKSTQEAVERDRAVRKAHVKWLIGTVLVLIGLVITLYFDVRSEKKKNKETTVNENTSQNNIQRNYVYNK